MIISRSRAYALGSNTTRIKTMAEAIYPGRWLNILAAAAATNSAPSLSTDGVDLKNTAITTRGRPHAIRWRHTATGARTFEAKVWGYVTSEVDTAGALVASSAGWVDTGETYVLASTSTNGSTAEIYEYLTIFDRIYIEITAITGTSATVNVSIALTES